MVEATVLNRIIAYVVATLFLLTAIACKKWHEYAQERRLRNLVTWSAIGDYCPALGRYSYVREPFFAILNAQCNDAIDRKYRINEETDKQLVIEIIEAYQKDIMQSYFKGHLKSIKSKYAISGEDYFMMALCGYLDEHHVEREFLGHDMHKERLEYKRYGNWGGPCYDATYALTDFAIVYHKLYYITYMFCKNSKITNPSGYSYTNEKFIKEILDTKEIQLSRY